MITPSVRGIYVVDVSGHTPYRSTKHCVCVSVGEGKYLIINTAHREAYDDLMICSSDYPFLKGVDRFIGCSPTSIWIFNPSHLIREAGTLTDRDTHRVVDKIIKSKAIPMDEKHAILAELAASLRAQ